MFEKLTALEARLDAVNRAMMDPATAGDANRFRDLAKEHSQLSEVVELWYAYKKVEASLNEAKELYGGDDEELRELAKAEIPTLEKKLEESATALRLALLPKDPHDGRPVILEIRAGTGGDEAALFAADLYRMYRRFGELRGLRFEEMSSSPIVAGGGAGASARGYKEIVCSVSGKEAWRLLRFEGGVHRVQRIPATENAGRIHTSAATIAVLPEPDEIQIKIEQKDLRIDTMRSGGPGGQSVNTTDSAVRIVHIPTGMIVVCQDEKSQIKNREKAMRVLKARLLEKEESERHAEETAARRAMVGSGDRSERIRTYNFPQNRLTDHRIGLTLYKLELIMNGDLTEVVEALANHHQAELLAAQESR